MGRLVAFCLVPVGLLLACAASGADKDLEQTLALQRVMQKVIAQAEPSVACILVSRSDGYDPLAGQVLAADQSAKFGNIHPNFLEKLAKERRKPDLADPNHVPEAFGSGVVIDPQGLVLTNYHVVREATRIFLRLPGGKAGYATVHAADARSDLAVLRVHDKSLLPLQAISLGDAAKVQRGQFVLTLANPFAAGFRDGQPSASWGIVSNLRRRVPGDPHEESRTKPLYSYGTLLQTDSRLQLGCSGGALLNLDGELVGLTTALAAIHGGETPGGYALPIDSGMRRILDVLRRGEEVDYGFLGVRSQPHGSHLGKGAEVEYVSPGSPADRDARLRVHDIILGINGAAVNESEDLFVHLGTQLAGTKVRLNVWRAASRKIDTVDVTLGKFLFLGKNVASSLGKRPLLRGLRVDYTTILIQQMSIQFVPAGVLISEVQPNSPAAQAQLKSGEVITHVNNQPVMSPDAFYRAATPLKGPIELQLHSLGSHEPPPKVVLK
jgi:S1-C subfamily serine protease